MNQLQGFILGIAICVAAVPVHAQVLTDHQNNAGLQQLTLTPVLSLSEIEYDVDGGGDVEIERTILGLAFTYGMHPSYDLYATAGYSLETEIENSRDDGDGFLFELGGQGKLYQNNQFSLHAALGVRYILEDYGSGTDGDLIETPLLLTARGQLSNQFGIYGGFELTPISDGEVEPSRGPDVDIERDNVLGLRLGADYIFAGGMRVNGEIGLISEEAFTLRLTLPLS